MNDIRLLMIITPREFESAYEDFLKADGIAAIFSTPCQGTAGKSILDLLGLAQSEKVLIAAMMTKPHAAKLMRGMIYKLGINMPGNGIALTLPISSIGGASCMKYLMENQNIIIGGGSDMDDRQPVFPFDLLVAITERGHVELVMDAGQTLLENGGEVFRVQQTMEIMAASLGVQDFHVYVLTNGIFASAHRPGQDASSLLRHVPTVSTHLGRVEAVNELSRELAAGNLDMAQAEQRLQAARALPRVGPRVCRR